MSGAGPGHGPGGKTQAGPLEIRPRPVAGGAGAAVVPKFIARQHTYRRRWTSEGAEIWITVEYGAEPAELISDAC
jgi:hypothetical protein